MVAKENDRAVLKEEQGDGGCGGVRIKRVRG